MGKTAAYRPTVTHLHITDVRRAFGQERTLLLEQRRTLYFVVRCTCANTQFAFIFFNVGQVIDAAQINEMPNRREP
jgi:hypothetical protein